MTGPSAGSGTTDLPDESGTSELSSTQQCMALQLTVLTPGPHRAVTAAPQDDGVLRHHGPEPGKNYHREKENPAPNLQAICQCLKCSLAIFPFALQEEPRNVSWLQSQNSPLILTLHHTQGSDPAASPAVPGSSRVGLCYWPPSEFARVVWSRRATSSHLLPSHTWEPKPGNVTATLLDS